MIYNIVFEADNRAERKLAEFAVIGNGSSDVDVVVHDETGRRVAVDDRFTDLALVRWVPARTQVYTVRVINLGSADRLQRQTSFSVYPAGTTTLTGERPVAGEGEENAEAVEQTKRPHHRRRREFRGLQRYRL